MLSLGSRPLLAVSLAIPSLLLIGYLWQKRRGEDSDLIESDSDQILGAIDSREVSQKLESLNRSRLDCIEEERQEEQEERIFKSVNPRPDVAACVEVGEESLSSRSITTVSIETAPVETIPEVSSDSTEGEISAVTVSSTSPESATMTLKEVHAEIEKKDSVPDVFSALKDPICELSTSPVKSESSDSQRSCESWSDLIEQDELEKSLCEKLSNLDLTENVRHDSGVASPTDDLSDSGRKGSDEKSRISSGEDAGIGGSETGDASDSGQGSELCLDDTQLLAYHFLVQEYLCGAFIGIAGANINKMKAECQCNITLKDEHYSNRSSKQKNDQGRGRGRDRSSRRHDDGHMNLCILEGTRINIDKCLDIIRQKFYQNPELTLEQINKPQNNNITLCNGSLTLSEGIMHDVFISSIVNGGHVFIQQPTHPTFSALERLDTCMYNTYTQLSAPEMPKPVPNNSLCVVNISDGWYRCEVLGYDAEEDICDIKYLDYGGYDTVSADLLKQIRSDFQFLPFQAIECYLANLVPTGEDSVSAGVLEELVSNQVVQARMIGLNEEGVPMVHLYRSVNGQTVMVNRELVDRSCADWIEATIVPILPPAVNHWNTIGDFSPSYGFPWL